jgi:ferritin-like metal-binding protein YciE
MALFRTSECESMHRLFISHLRCLYDSELRLIDALPRFLAAAHSDRLKQACVEHLGETDRQVGRLEELFELITLKPRRVTDRAVAATIEAAELMMRADGDPSVRDAALIAALQSIEHLEIAAYGTARTWALHLGLRDAADLLQATLAEERTCDHGLTELAESGINAVATYVTETPAEDRA